MSVCQTSLGGENTSIDNESIVDAANVNEAEEAGARIDASLARALVAAGTPAALGMQGNFPDPASDTLAASLYGALAAGLTLGEAARQMRNQLQFDYPQAVGLPVVYVAPGGDAAFALADGHADVADLTQTGRVDLPTVLTPPNVFLGREQALHELAKLKRTGEAESGPIVTVVGTGGIGKSALAGAFARRFAWRYPGGVVGVTLADSATLSPEVTLLDLLRRLGVDPAPLANLPAEQINETLLTILRDRPASVIVDNYESVLQLLDGDAPALNDRSNEAETGEDALGEWLRLEPGAGANASAAASPAGRPGARRTTAALDLAAAAGRFCGRGPISARQTRNVDRRRPPGGRGALPPA